MKRHIIYLITITGLLFVITGKSLSNPLTAGIAKVNITPESVPVHDSTYIRIMILQDGKTRIAIASGDIVFYENKELFSLLCEKYSLESLMLCCSHTHSGVINFNFTEAYYEKIKSALEEGIILASKNQRNVLISAGKAGFPQLGYNRLISRDDGYCRGPWIGDDKITPMNPEKIPYGPVDPEVTVIKVEDTEHNPMAILMNYACHSDVVSLNFEISADYPGVAAATVEEHYKNNMICMFIQGAAGNIAPLFVSPRKENAEDDYPVDYSQMEKMGKILANETIRIAESLVPGNEAVSGLAVKNDTYTFTGRFNKELQYNLLTSTILINKQIALATFPGEAFIYFQKYWKETADVKMPVFFGYTCTGGNWAGYVADIRSAAYGGFGADADYNLIETGAGEKIMLKHLENLYRLEGITRDQPGPAPDWSIQHTFLRK